MPWTNRGHHYDNETSGAQKTFNIFAILAIFMLFLAASVYQTSIGTMERSVSALRVELFAIKNGNIDAPRVTNEIDSNIIDNLRQEIADIRNQILSFDTQLEKLSSKTVDVQSMEAFREDLLGTKQKIAKIETGLVALNVSPQELGKEISAKDVATALAQARIARAELKEFKEALGYGGL